MAEFHGTPTQIAIQERMRDRHTWIANTPAISNGGRILNILDADAIGWERIRSLAEEDGFISLTAYPLDTAKALIKAHFDDGWSAPHWDVFIGDAETVTAHCRDVCAATPLPDGWHVESHRTPTDAVIDQVQALNLETGVAPTPAWYLRSTHVPNMTTLITDADGHPAAAALTSFRYHPQSRLAGHVFAGSVSVLPQHRGLGLGKYANARTLLDSHAEFGWTHALEQVKSDNPVSRRMTLACGLARQPGIATVGIGRTGQNFTR